MFVSKCEHIVEAARVTRPAHPPEDQESLTPWASRLGTMFRRGSQLSTVQERTEDTPPKERKAIEPRRLRPDMIRRMDDAPKLVNPSGWISEGNVDLPNIEKSDTQFVSSPTSTTSITDPTRQLAFADDVKAGDSDSSTSPGVHPSESIRIRKSRSPSRCWSVRLGSV
jgi:hypothetical protein